MIEAYSTWLSIIIASKNIAVRFNLSVVTMMRKYRMIEFFFFFSFLRYFSQDSNKINIGFLYFD